MLLSGGLDSATALYIAKSGGYSCECLIFDYGQRHRREIKAAQAVARAAGCPCRVVKISLPWKGSALLDKNISIPAHKTAKSSSRQDIPATYVPGRNIIFLSFALSASEALGARALFIGAHSQDYSGYPDCRPQFFRAFQKAAACGTKAGVEGGSVVINTPLLHMTKAQIIKTGARLGVPFGLTWSCYRGARHPCGKCDSCVLRAKGFKDAGLNDSSTG